MKAIIRLAPQLGNYLDESSKVHFDQLCALLTEYGLNYQLNPNLVRGLDYYTHTVFEWVTESLGAQGTVCGGGRYDGLVEQLGGGSVPAVGFSAGLERLILFLYPSFVVLINGYVFKMPISKLQKVSLMVTYVGILLAFVGEVRLEPHDANFYWGCFFIFLCAVTFSIYTAGSGKMVAQIGATKFTAYAMLAATMGVLLHYVLAGKNGLMNANTDVIVYGVLLALVATVIPSFLINLGMKYIGSTNVAIISCIGPVSTILQANWFLGEKIHVGQIIGTALVIVGILITAWEPKNSLAK